jgi:plasmid maintenance system antidote protein VapI
MSYRPVNRTLDKKIGLYGILMFHTQYKVAKAVRVYPERISDYMYGRRPIPDIVLLRLCDYLDVPPERILEPFQLIEV